MEVFESPLVSHVRMRALYRALVEVRGLGPKLGRRRLPRGLEAAWVAGVIDLKDGDVVFERRGGGVVEFVRTVGLRAAAGVGAVKDVRRALGEGAATFAGTGAERLTAAIGAAVALKRAAQGGVSVGFAAEDELTAAEWTRVLALAREGDLPLVLFCVGAAAGDSAARKVARVPVIPVDAGDVLAIYRVAQESYVRARAEGGVAVIECVRFGTDPVKLFGAQLAKKGICTERWVAGCEEQFRAVMAKV